MATLLGAPARWARQDVTLRRAGIAAVVVLWVVGILDGSDGSIGRSFEVCFVACAATAALAVEARSRWSAAMLPVAVLIGALGGLVLARPSMVDVSGLSPNVGRLGHWFAAILDHGVPLLAACGLALVVAALRRSPHMSGEGRQPGSSST